ncbi:hypothetical protein HMPREF1572_00426 [Gardnerella vaginalis JCP7275]|nr:hypothetical protein HMPREF1572_00426 [Gardnerella vaginalis JCP7275]
MVRKGNFRQTTRNPSHYLKACDTREAKRQHAYHTLNASLLT